MNTILPLSLLLAFSSTTEAGCGSCCSDWCYGDHSWCTFDGGPYRNEQICTSYTTYYPDMQSCETCVPPTPAPTPVPADARTYSDDIECSDGAPVQSDLGFYSTSKCGCDGRNEICTSEYGACKTCAEKAVFHAVFACCESACKANEDCVSFEIGSNACTMSTSCEPKNAWGKGSCSVDDMELWTRYEYEYDICDEYDEGWDFFSVSSLITFVVVGSILQGVGTWYKRQKLAKVAVTANNGEVHQEQPQQPLQAMPMPMPMPMAMPTTVAQNEQPQPQPQQQMQMASFDPMMMQQPQQQPMQMQMMGQQPQQQLMQPMQMQMMGQPNPQFGAPMQLSAPMQDGTGAPLNPQFGAPMQFSTPMQFSAPMQVGTGAPLQFGQLPQFNLPNGKS